MIISHTTMANTHVLSLDKVPLEQHKQKNFSTQVGRLKRIHTGLATGSLFFPLSSVQFQQARYGRTWQGWSNVYSRSIHTSAKLMAFSCAVFWKLVPCGIIYASCFSKRPSIHGSSASNRLRFLIGASKMTAWHHWKAFLPFQTCLSINRSRAR